MSKNVSRKRVRSIPERLFYQLWELSEEEESSTQFARKIMHPNSKYHLVYKKYKIEREYFMDMLLNIWTMSHADIRIIVEQSGMKKSTVAQLMCIPTNTFNNWYYKRTECPSYVRLFLLRYFGYFTLGHFIYLESEEPAMYVPKKKEVEELPIIQKYKYESFKDWEQTHVHKENVEVEDLLARLKYLDNF